MDDSFGKENHKGRLKVVYITLGSTSMEGMSRLEQMMFTSPVQFSSVQFPCTVLRGLGGIYDSLIECFVTPATRREYFSALPYFVRCKWYDLAGLTGTLTPEEIKIAKAVWRRFCHSVHVE